MSGRFRLWAAVLLLSLAGTACAQGVTIAKIDPPNWWAELPKPMLLVQGQGLAGAKFSLSDPAIAIEKTSVSQNGHWAELWLSRSPSAPETVQIEAQANGAHTSMAYTFAPRRAATDGFAGFSSRDVMYLIMTDRFADGDTSNDGPPGDRQKPRGWHGGDLRGVLQHLDYLQELGITTVWITPVYQNHGQNSYHGYSATDMYAVDEHFGSLDDLKALADALHQRGMKLVLDTVPNHVGAAHPWVNDSPEPDWFHGTKAQHANAVTDFGRLVDPHAPFRDQRDITQGWFANALPDMNQENPAVAQYLIQNAVWWEEQTGADGLRLDTFPFVGRAFWHAFHEQLHTLYPHLTSVGEIFNSSATITSAFAGGAVRTGINAIDTGLDTPFDFPSFFAVRDAFLNNKPMTRLGDVLRADSLYPHPERLVPFFGNHDTTRFMNEPGASLPKLKLAFTVVTTMRGMPEIYSGDEIAMRGGADPDNRRDFPGGFPGDKANAFTSAGRTPEQQEAFAALQKLLTLRHVTPALESGEEQVLQADNDVLVYVRSLGPQHVLIAVNKAAEVRAVNMHTNDTALAGLTQMTLLLGTAQACCLVQDRLTLQLAPESASILSVQ